MPDLSADPGWEGFRNRLLPERRPVTRQDFGYSPTRHAGGQRAGEIGGRVQRSLTPAKYAVPLPRELTLDDRLVASGKMTIPQNNGPSGVLVGWFHESSRGWRTSNSLAFRADGNGDTYWLFFEYGTRHGRTRGMGCFEGERYQTTPTEPFAADETVHEWRLEYDPDAADGVGTVAFQVDERRYSFPFRREDRDDGAVFDRFGIWNQETTGESVEIWLDDLVVNGVEYAFDEEGDWVGRDNRTEFTERVVRPYHDYGYVAPDDDAGQPGSIGGLIWRDEEPSYYADSIGRLTLDEPLYAEGTIRFLASGADSAVYIGWFDSASKQNKAEPEYEARQQNYLAILLEGPSRVGHYFRPGYGTTTGGGSNAERGPLLPMDDNEHAWTLRYDPQATDGRGAIHVTLDAQRVSLALREGDRAEGATFDRFGLFNIQSGGWHVEVYVRELRYVVGEE